MKFLEINCFEFAKAWFRPAAVISDQCCGRNAALRLQGNDTGCGVRDFFYLTSAGEGERIQGGRQLRTGILSISGRLVSSNRESDTK